MPNKNTFLIKPIKSFLKVFIYLNPGIYADPFCGYCSPAQIKNDLNPAIEADFNLDCNEFAINLKPESFDHILFDPPYSPRQAKECYLSMGKKFFKEDGQQGGYYGKCRNILGEKMFKGSFAISFGWNSTGFGKVRGFEIKEILLVNHSGTHADTICMVEEKQ